MFALTCMCELQNFKVRNLMQSSGMVVNVRKIVKNICDKATKIVKGTNQLCHT